MSLPTLALFCASVAVGGKPAPAPPSITTSGDASEAVLTVKGVNAAAKAELRAAGDLLTLELAGDTRAPGIDLDDATVKRALIADHHLALSLGQPAAPLLENARVETAAGLVVIHIPRHAPASAPAPAPAPAVAAPALAPAPATLATAAAPPPAPAPTPVAEPVPLAPAPSLPRGWLLIGGLLLAAVILVRHQRLKKGLGKKAPGKKIEVLASTPLGGKTRAVLMQVADTELLVAVSDTGARLIGSWAAGERDDAQPHLDALTHDDAREPAPPPPPLPAPQRSVSVIPPRPRPSPAVAGLLKMKKDLAQSGTATRVRHYTEGFLAAPENGPDEDAAWARELVRAARNGGELS